MLHDLEIYCKLKDVYQLEDPRLAAIVIEKNSAEQMDRTIELLKRRIGKEITLNVIIREEWKL